MRSAITRVQPATFFVVTYGLSWLIWIPLVLSHFGIGPVSIPEGISSVVRLFGVLMPATSVILAFLWGTWHLPFWLLLDIFDQYGFGYLALNYVFGFPLTLYITWLYNHGRSSLLLPVALHVVFNIVNVAWLPVTSNVGAFGFVIVVEWILALLVIPHLEAEPFQATKPIPA